MRWFPHQGMMLRQLPVWPRQYPVQHTNINNRWGQSANAVTAQVFKGALLPPAHPYPKVTEGANTHPLSTAVTTLSTPIEVKLLDMQPIQTKIRHPENQTKYRQSLFRRANDNAIQFLGKFLYGSYIPAAVLPPVQQETVLVHNEAFANKTQVSYTGKPTTH